MLNTITLMGRLTHDIELRSTPTGVSLTKFNIAVDRDYKKEDGTRETDFIDCVAWRQKAEFVEKYFHKGDQIAVTGRLQTETYTDQENKKRKYVSVVVSDVYFAGAKKDSAGNNQNGGWITGESKGDNEGFMNIPDNLDDVGLPFN